MAYVRAQFCENNDLMYTDVMSLITTGSDTNCISEGALCSLESAYTGFELNNLILNKEKTQLDIHKT